MTRVFCNPAGQRDNLGDSVLRRPYLAALREGGDLHVLVGDDADYASGLGITGVDTGRALIGDTTPKVQTASDR